MINLRELRLGNLVYHNEKATPIIGIGQSGNGFTDVGYFNDDKWDVEPILLTEEWVIKLGIQKMPETEYTQDTYDLAGFKLWYNKGQFLFADKWPILYVHQLQNLYFSFKGEELTIDDPNRAAAVL